jgi:hypothetical protein
MGPRPPCRANALRNCSGELGFRAFSMFGSHGTNWYSVLLNSTKLRFFPTRDSEPHLQTKRDVVER